MLTVMFLIANAVMLLVLFVPTAIATGDTSDCGSSCPDIVTTGGFISAFGPSLVFIVNVVLSIVLLVKKRTTWLVCLLMGVGGLVVFFIGIALMYWPAS